LKIINAYYTSNAGHIDSYYAATASATPPPRALIGEIDADVCIIGGGFSGLSTALHLCNAGRHVTLLEGARIGWGASGRNGGQIVNGLNASLQTIGDRYGDKTADFVGGIVQEGASIIRDFISEYGIECDLKQGNIFAAFNAKQMKELEEKKALWQRHGMNEHELLDRTAMQKHIGSERYMGGMMDHSGGHIHPLNLALGEAAALRSSGATLYEETRMLSVEKDATKPVVITNNGRVTCNTLVLCGNAYLGEAEPRLASRVMPVSTQVMATEPLGDALAEELLPTDVCVEDVRYILDYYRLSADKRLLFGGGTVYGGTDPADIRAKLRPAMLKVFPQLQHKKIDYAWSGNFALSYSRVPQMGMLDDHTYYAMGYSGHGVTGSHLFGRIVSEAITGNKQRFDRFAQLPWHAFPGGQRFRAQYSTAGSWWYGFRDKVGL
jgi:gamma-glutamylputrescine oxidase